MIFFWHEIIMYPASGIKHTVPTGDKFRENKVRFVDGGGHFRFFLVTVRGTVRGTVRVPAGVSAQHACSRSVLLFSLSLTPQKQKHYQPISTCSRQ